MILGGEADVAAIDCVTDALLERHRPRALAGTRVLCHTAKAPAPPYVAGSGVSAEALPHFRSVLSAVIEDPTLRSVRQDLLLDGVAFLPLDAYQPIAACEKMALTRHGYRDFSRIEAAA